MSIKFPDVELLLTGYLRQHLGPAVYVGRKVPDQHEPRMVTVRRQGGEAFSRFMDRARIGVNVWAPTDREANDLASTVRALLHKASGEGLIKNLRSQGPAEVDSDIPLPHRYFTAEFHVKGAALQTGG